MIKAVIFDMDGVLVDAKEWHYEALNRALGLFGFNINRDMHVSEYNGLPTREKLRRLSRQRGFPLSLMEFVNEIKQKYTTEEIDRNCNPFFEKQFMVSRLKADGYFMAVCSNAIKKSVLKMLDKSGILNYFDETVGNDEGYPSKPDPTMYIETIKKLGLTPNEVVIVEDAPHGIEAAKASGAYVCEVAGFEEVNYDRIKDFIDKVNTGRIDRERAEQKSVNSEIYKGKDNYEDDPLITADQMHNFLEIASNNKITQSKLNKLKSILIE